MEVLAVRMLIPYGTGCMVSYCEMASSLQLILPAQPLAPSLLSMTETMSQVFSCGGTGCMVLFWIKMVLALLMIQTRTTLGWHLQKPLALTTDETWRERLLIRMQTSMAFCYQEVFSPQSMYPGRGPLRPRV